MKFHCDRCKTRYSIADERVRGKILKIRCKNCSAVITVRENMPEAPAPSSAVSPANSGSVRKPTTADGPMARTLAGTGAAGARPARSLKGAGAPSPDRSMSSSSPLAAAVSTAPQPQPQPQPPPVPPPPDTLEEEWYVSLDGNQVGPFNLEEAKDWVAAREPTDDLYCWNEDFDDWLPIEKVSHFRGLRTDKLAALGIGAAPTAPRSDTEQASPVVPAAEDPATEENMRAPSYAEPDVFDRAGGGFAAGGGFDGGGFDKPAVGPNRAGEPPTLGEDDGFDLDIGEASRIVKLPMLMRGMNAAGAAPDAGGDNGAPADDEVAPPPGADEELPGVARIGRGSGSIGRLPADAPALAPLSDSAMASASPDILHATPSSLKRQWLIIAIVAALIPGLVIFFVITRDGGGDDDEVGPRRSGYQGLGAGGSSTDPSAHVGIKTTDNGDSNGKSKGRRNPNRHNSGKVSHKKTARDAGAASGDMNARPLGPADITRAARRGGAANRRCYMRAQRKDFDIARIKRIRFYIKVDPSGTVTQVTPKEHQDTYLARCVRNAIRRWKFRKSPKGIATETAIVFAQ